ncbi:MAG: hypothetical protein WAU95_21665, partial [Anaerolineae bacterium]
MSQQTHNHDHEADYEIEMIVTGLFAQVLGVLARWQATFLAACDGWQLDRAAILLRMLKGRSLDENAQGVVRYSEGTLLVKRGDWAGATAAYQ